MRLSDLSQEQAKSLATATKHAELVRNTALQDLKQYEPLVAQCEDYVNDWLSQTFDNKS